MKAEVKLFATLKRFMPKQSLDNPWIVDIEKNTTINELIKKIDIPINEVKIIFLNGIHAKGDEILKDNDRIGIFPPVGGG